MYVELRLFLLGYLDIIWMIPFGVGVLLCNKNFQVGTRFDHWTDTPFFVL